MSSDSESTNGTGAASVLQLFADDASSTQHVKFIRVNQVLTIAGNPGSVKDGTSSGEANPVSILFQEDIKLSPQDVTALKKEGYNAKKINCFYWDSGIYFIVLPGSAGHTGFGDRFGCLIPRDIGDISYGADKEYLPDCENELSKLLINLCHDIIGCARGFGAAFTSNDKEYQTVKVFPKQVLAGDCIRVHAKVLQTSVKSLIRRFFEQLNTTVFGSCVGKHMAVIGFDNVNRSNIDWVTACGLIYAGTIFRRPVEIASGGKYQYVYAIRNLASTYTSVVTVASNLYLSVQGFSRDMVSDCDDMDWDQFHGRVVELLIELQNVATSDIEELRKSLSQRSFLTDGKLVTFASNLELRKCSDF